jgi:hypothetical protein
MSQEFIRSYGEFFVQKGNKIDLLNTASRA